jgi:hypothetical protein
MELKEEGLMAEETDPVLRLIEKLEARVDSQEELLANLMMAYAEVWAAMENLTANFLSTRTDEEQEKFMKDFREFRTEMLKNLKQASERGMETVDEGLLAAMERMVDRE